MADAKFVRIFHQDIENDRMQMQMQMAVDVVEWQAGGVELFKLRVDFRAKLFAEVAFEKIIQSDADRTVEKFTACIDEAGNFSWRQRGTALQQSQVQTSTEFWVLFREFYRFVEAGFIYHQTRGRQNAFTMRAYDGLIHGARKAEVVRIHNQAANGIRGCHNLELSRRK